jgi:hypothetical protein
VHQSRADASDRSIHRPQIGCALARAIQDEQLVLEQERLRDDRSSAAAAKESGDRDHQVENEYDQMPHPIIVAVSATVTRLGNRQDLCDKSEIRHTQVNDR